MIRTPARELPAPDGYTISTDPARLDRDLVHHWLATDTYWAAGRPRERQDRAMDGSLNFGVYETASGRQVGYARVVTDHTTFAWLCDVYIDRAARGRGLGGALARAVRDHLAPCGLRRIMLATADAHGVYERAGFRRVTDTGTWMTYGTEDRTAPAAPETGAAPAAGPAPGAEGHAPGVDSEHAP
ncbi:GNAT family N-acetyltransferase [Streptomyces sp. Ru73]|uniref:GNAT family N-acetyltransferase n=1 Tax=Streptomyces sp. Ru73 TaxID=2080748 RepID=UPI000CDD2D0D|nr:GNAT family N-acetyltransferase [Streptomyces sp. Ru73]POX43085.1 GNAT family N-acetyltransferase [Streptomyces sp. Ru73]